MTEYTETTDLGFDTPVIDPELAFWKGKERPKATDEKVLNEICADLSKHLCEWCNEELTEENLKEHQEVLFNILKYNVHADSYSITKDLEDATYMADSTLYELIDDNLDVYGFHNKHIKLWTKANDLKPKYPINTKLNLKFKGEYHKVFIHSISESDATYTVNFPNLGHKQDEGTVGFVIPFETVESNSTIISDE